jgi:hypothetical protein
MPVNRSKPYFSPITPLPHPTSGPPGENHATPCSALVRLTEKVASLEQWRNTTEVDLKEIRDVISQVRLLMSLSVGGGGLSLLTLVVLIVDLIAR